MNPYSKLGYLAIVVETVAGTTVKPTTYVELLNENIVANYVVQPVSPIAGKRDVNLRIAKDKIEVAGDITILVEPKKIGHFLKNFAGAPTTSTIAAGKSYQHLWDLANSNEVTYTFDIKPADADYVMRYSGVKISQMAFSQSDNKIQVVISIMAQKAFTNARATAALANTTALQLDQTSGITTGDVLRFINKDTLATRDTASITSIDSETAITLAAGATTSIDDIIVINKSTPTYAQDGVLTWIGGATVKMASKNDSGNPINNTAIQDCEEFSVNFLNELEARYTAKGCTLADRFPNAVRVKGFSANGNIKAIFTNSSRIDDLRSNEQVALRFDFSGKQLDTNSATTASLVIGTGAAQINITASTAGSAGNDLNVRIITNSADSLVASVTGNNVLVKLASTTTASNTGTLVAAAINALTSVDSSSPTGTGQVGIAAKTNLASGRDANEKALLRVDLPAVFYDPFNDNIAEENLVEEDIKWNAYYDDTDSRTCRIVLRNDVASY